MKLAYVVKYDKRDNSCLTTGIKWKSFEEHMFYQGTKKCF